MPTVGSLSTSSSVSRAPSSTVHIPTGLHGPEAEAPFLRRRVLAIVEQRSPPTAVKSSD